MVGAAIIVGSLSAALASFGVASPLSIIGITIGTTLLAQSLSIGVGGVGLVALSGGVGLFGCGMRHGLSKTMKQCVDVAEKKPEDDKRFLGTQYVAI